MTEGEVRLDGILRDYQGRLMANWTGHEQEFLIELVRALDETVFAFTLAPNATELRAKDGYRHAMLQGVGVALGPFLVQAERVTGGIPWEPTTPKLASFVDEYLYNCGTIWHLHRLAGLERYGLAQTTFISKTELRIEVASADAEAHDVAALNTLRRRARLHRKAVDENLAVFVPEAIRQVAGYVEIDREHFIRYDNDLTLVAYYREIAKSRATVYFEREALPDTSTIGGRAFQAWCDDAIAASGRVLQHVAFATSLRKRHSHLDLRNLLTIFARREDVLAVLEEAGGTPEAVAQFMSAATLSSDQAATYAADYETPAPFYIPIARDFVLLPCFGALLNPLVGVVRYLKGQFRSDWDRVVLGREHVFREEMRELFPSPRFVVSEAGIRLRRDDGSELTDIDASVYDRSTETIGLFQLKWHDIYGRSTRERNSRRLNLLRANAWVEAVSTWLQGHSVAELVRMLKLNGDIRGAPKLFIVSRYAANFSGDAVRDARASWVGWADLVRAASVADGNVLGGITEFARRPKKRSKELSTEPERFVLPGLTVDVIVNPDLASVAQ